MSNQLYAGMGLGALLLFIVIGAGVYVSSNDQADTEVPQENVSQEEEVEEFTARMREETIARVGQPIEGFEPSMFMEAFPGLIASDFADVDALIGLYLYEDGEVIYDLNGEVELHSAARAISDEGMAQLLANISSRITFMAGEDLLDQLFLAISPKSSTGHVVTPAEDERITIKGVITCLPHKGSGPHTMECAFGLEGEDGFFYGLSNLWAAAPNMTDTGVEIVVTGTFTTAAASEKYDIVGYIEVERAEKQ